METKAKPVIPSFLFITSLAKYKFFTSNNKITPKIKQNFHFQPFDEDYSKTPQWWDSQEDVVISGISGRFPEAQNIKEFMDNLFEGVDMITEDNRRWDPGRGEMRSHSATNRNHSFRNF